MVNQSLKLLIGVTSSLKISLLKQRLNLKTIEDWLVFSRLVLILRNPWFIPRVFIYHRIITLPQVNPLPKAAKTTKSPDLTLPDSQASVKAIGIDAAVVFP